MEMNVRALEDQAFHKMHATPFAHLPGMEGVDGGNRLRVRYDGVQKPEGPRIHAVFFADDIAPILDRIPFPHPPGIGLPGTDIFFMEGPDGLALYVDTDTQEDLWINILDEANDAGLEVVQAKSDLAMICRVSSPFDGMSRDVDPPARAGYAMPGLSHVPIETGMDLMKRRARLEGPSDDPSVPGF